MNPKTRAMAGMVSVALYLGVAAWSWAEGILWLAVLAGVLGLIRLRLLVRQWPRREDPTQDPSSGEG